MRSRDLAKICDKADLTHIIFDIRMESLYHTYSKQWMTAK
jgi:hypothetical protein